MLTWTCLVWFTVRRPGVARNQTRVRASRLPDVAHRESVREWIVRIDDVRCHTSDPRLTAECRHDGGVLPDSCLLNEAAGEYGSQHAGMPEVPVSYTHLTLPTS